MDFLLERGTSNSKAVFSQALKQAFFDGRIKKHQKSDSQSIHHTNDINFARSQNSKRTLSFSALENHIGKNITKDLLLHFDEYTKDIESITHLKIQEKQKKELKNYINNNQIVGLTPEETKRERKHFSYVRKQLIESWEKNTNQDWPKYDHDIYDKRGNLYRQKGSNYDAHHIIELKFGGPAKWWNLHPATSPDQHQNGIHRESGVANKIFGDIARTF